MKFSYGGKEYHIQQRRFDGYALQLIRGAYFAELCHEGSIAEQHGLSHESPSEKVNGLVISEIKNLFLSLPAILPPVLNYCCDECESIEEATRIVAGYSKPAEKKPGETKARTVHIPGYEDITALGTALYLSIGAEDAGKSSLGLQVSQRMIDIRRDSIKANRTMLEAQIKILQSLLGKISGEEESSLTKPSPEEPQETNDGSWMTSISETE